MTTETTTEPTFTVTTGRFGGISYRLLGPAGAIEWMGSPSISMPSIPDGLYHYAADVDGDGEDGACECEVLPQGRCWPGAGMLMGESEAAFRSGDAARIEAQMREVYVGLAAEVAGGGVGIPGRGGVVGFADGAGGCGVAAAGGAVPVVGDGAPLGPARGARVRPVVGAGRAALITG